MVLREWWLLPSSPSSPSVLLWRLLLLELLLERVDNREPVEVLLPPDLCRWMLRRLRPDPEGICSSGQGLSRAMLLLCLRANPPPLVDLRTAAEAEWDRLGGGRRPAA